MTAIKRQRTRKNSFVGLKAKLSVRGGSQGHQEGRAHRTSFLRKTKSRTGRTRSPQDHPASRTSEDTAGGKGI